MPSALCTLPLNQYSRIGEYLEVQSEGACTMPVNHSHHDDIEITNNAQSDQQAYYQQRSVSYIIKNTIIQDGHLVLIEAENQEVEQLKKQVALVIPSTSPQPDTTSIPPSQRAPSQSLPVYQEEKALRYLERKRVRQERTTTQIQAIKTHSTGAISQPLLSQQTPIASPASLRNSNQPPLVPSVAQTLPTVRQPSTNRLTTATQKREVAQRQRKILLRHISRKYLRRDRLGKQHARERFWFTLLSTIATLVILLLTTTSGSAWLAYHFYLATQDQYADQVLTLRSLMPHDNLKMFDVNGIPIGQLTDQGIHTSVVYNQIAPYLINATVSTEDKDFWTNPGIDIPRIAQAAVQDLARGRVIEGGSTITQQLIKNIVLRNPAQDMSRKLQEVALTPQLNSHYSKKDIMEMYLNSIYYGEQAYGIDAAANIYFGLEDQPGKPAASQLDLAQAALLAGLPSSPNGYDPWVHFETSMNRLTEVLNLMHRDGQITADQLQAALNEAQLPGFLKHPAVTLLNRAPHFFEFVLEQLQKQYHMTRQQLSLSDMRVYTTLDVNLQDHILQIAQAQITKLQANHVTNAAEVLIDYHTGAVRTLLGNVHPNTDDFDVATQGYRQPGSSFKPYVYVTAFEQGVSPGQAVDDAPISIPQVGQSPFTPKNYFNQFYGHMTLRCALQNSLNIPAVKVIEHVGVPAAIKTMQDIGITNYKGDLNDTIVLGSLDLHLIDHTSAIGTFADGGIHVPYYTIEKVEFANTHQVFNHQKNPGKRAISPQLAYMMTDVLSDNSDRAPEFGYCNPLNLRTDGTCYGPALPAAAKTGTTNDFRDTWTVGYTSDYVLGVWVGNNDNSPMININGITGAAPIWHDAMLAAEAGHSPKAFINPGGLVKVDQHYSDGVQTNDWYLASQVPAPSTNKNPSTPISGASDTHLQPSAPVTAQPYCSSYSFDAQPPAESKQPTNGLSPFNQDWW